MIYLRLFWEFFKTGLFAIGGGLATIPFLYDMSARTGWFSSSDISNMLAVSESTPGPIGVNMATYVGYHVGGLLGGIVSTLALVLPSVIIILMVARALKAFRDNVYVKNVLYGIRPASLAMIAYAGLLVFKISMLYEDKIGTGNVLSWINYKAIALGAVILFAYLKWKKHPIVYILAAAVCGVVFKF